MSLTHFHRRMSVLNQHAGRVAPTRIAQELRRLFGTRINVSGKVVTHRVPVHSNGSHESHTAQQVHTFI